MAEQAHDTGASAGRGAAFGAGTGAGGGRQRRAGVREFFEVRRTPEQVVLNLGLEKNAAGGVPVRLQAKVVLNFWAAKRLAALLQNALADHERTFGALELNPQRPLRPTP